MKKNVAVLFGGCSTEHAVSLQSAHAVLCHLDKEKYAPIPVGITRDGRWFRYTGPADALPGGRWADDAAHLVPAILSPDRSVHGLVEFLPDGSARTTRLDAVLPILHGKNGEDGTVQGLCELAGIPLAGCGTLSSALCMDKHRAHLLAQLAGVQTPRAFVLRPLDTAEDAATQAEGLGYPLFVKPVRAGSSFGVTRVARREALPAALHEAFRHDAEVLVEQAIPGFEVGCAVLGPDAAGRLVTGEVDEIELAGGDGFFDYTEKYTLKTSAIHVPARIPAQKAAEIKQAAQAVYRALGCTGFARVDLFLTPEGGIFFNEVNTIPGFTAHSRYPSMMKAAGLGFAQVLDLILGQVMEA